MKKKQPKIIFALIFVLVVATMIFFVKQNFVSEKKILTIAPADFVESKRCSLDLLGGLVNHGFRVRDEVWEICLSPQKMELLQLTLFAGNQYWFAASASAPAKRLKLTLYDEEGSPVSLDLWKDDHTIPVARVAGGLVVTRSGNYYVGLELAEEEGTREAVPASLVYAYQ